MSEDYSTMQFRAVVDWLELEIQTTKPTNFMTIQKKLRVILCLPECVNPYVKPLNAGDGGTATIFTLRIQDPERYHIIESTLNSLALALEYEITARPTAVEVALDAYNSTPEQAERFCKYSTSPIKIENCRIYREHGLDATQWIPLRPNTLTKHLQEGWQVALGHDKDDYRQHVYFKMKDRCKDLPAEEHRARIEVTLKGNALPFQTLEELKHFKFSDLSEFFQFRMLKPDLTPLGQITSDNSPRIGARRSTKRKEGGGVRAFSRLTLADTALNTHARTALKELARRWTVRPKRQNQTSKPIAENIEIGGITEDFAPESPNKDGEFTSRPKYLLCNSLNTTPK